MDGKMLPALKSIHHPLTFFLLFEFNNGRAFHWIKYTFTGHRESLFTNILPHKEKEEQQKQNLRAGEWVIRPQSVSHAKEIQTKFNSQPETSTRGWDLNGCPLTYGLVQPASKQKAAGTRGNHHHYLSLRCRMCVNLFGCAKTISFRSHI